MDVGGQELGRFNGAVSMLSDFLGVVGRLMRTSSLGWVLGLGLALTVAFIAFRWIRGGMD